MSLRVAIVHYHLRRGGVTRVIEHATEALLERGARVAWIAGEPTAVERPEGVSVETVPELAYGEKPRAPGPPGAAKTLRRAARRALGAPPDIWHVHNHSLGKNVTLPAVVAEFAAAGERLLLQLHDFAEDARPANYGLLAEWFRAAAGNALYPTSPTVHYAVLNRRDHRFLAAAGMPREWLHVLPNPVAKPALSDDAASAPAASSSVAGRYHLYPTRAIRRKNLGEFLLWSALAFEGDRFATTLAPENPLERPVYDRWEAFSRERGLPVEFAVGERGDVPVEELIRSTTHLVTTSVQEGFGMAFLEPWLFDRPLVGRDLPDITEDFKADGLDLSTLYERLDVPVEWLGEGELRARIDAALRETYAAYGRSPPEDGKARAFAAAVWNDRVDVARLDEPLIESVIDRVLHDAGARDAVTPRALVPREDFASAGRNRSIVEELYDLESYGERLDRVYRALLAAESDALEWVEPDRVLDAFLAPERFRLLGAPAGHGSSRRPG